MSTIDDIKTKLGEITDLALKNAAVVEDKVRRSPVAIYKKFGKDSLIREYRATATHLEIVEPLKNPETVSRDEFVNRLYADDPRLEDLHTEPAVIIRELN